MLEKYYRLSEATGVSLYIRADGTEVWGLCRVEIRNNQLNITEKEYGLTQAALFGRLKAGTPIALNLSGKGVLDKISGKLDNLEPANFSKLLPNARRDDFYLQHFVSGDTSFVSVMRRAEAQKWLELFNQRRLPVLMLTFGPFPVQQVLSQLNFYHAEIFAGYYLIDRNERGEWVNWYENLKDTEPEYTVRLAGEDFDFHLLPAYAGVFQLVLNDTLSLIESDYDQGIRHRLRYLTQRKYRTYGALVLMSCFIALLLNFGLFSSLNGANVRMAEEADRSARTSSDQELLSRSITGEQELLKTLGWDGGKSKAGMADRMVSLLPVNLSLTGLSVQPQDAVAARMQQTLQFRNNLITAIGTSERVVPVNEWIARLKAQKWVHDARLESFVVDPEKNTGRFIVQLNY